MCVCVCERESVCVREREKVRTRLEHVVLHQLAQHVEPARERDLFIDNLFADSWQEVRSNAEAVIIYQLSSRKSTTQNDLYW